MFNKSLLKKYSSIIGVVARCLDPLIVIFAALIAYSIKFEVGLFDVSKGYRLMIGFSVFILLFVFPFFNIYSSWRGVDFIRLVRTMFIAWLTVVLIIIVVLFLLKLSYDYSRVWLALWFCISFVMLVLGRLIIYAFLKIQRRHGRNLRYVVIVGAGDLGQEVLRQVRDSSWIGYSVSAFFDDNSGLLHRSIDDVQVVGDVDSVYEYVIENDIDEVWIALPLRAEARMKELLNSLRLTTVNIKLIPDIFGFSLLHHSMSEIAGVPVVNLSASPMHGINRVLKATEDRVLAALILVLISPLLAVISLGVKLSSDGPVFFRQKRVSWNGQVFDMLKFRSMHDGDSTSHVWGAARSKEVTRFGRFLRTTSLDELPQFFNVLKGEMSIVGPRPERVEFVEKFKHEIPGYMQKHMVKAGITGWAQINGWRGDTCLNTRIEHDLYYIENWSLWLDLKIILLTLFKGFVNKNAY